VSISGPAPPPAATLSADRVEIDPVDALTLRAIMSGIPERTSEQHADRYESQEQGHGLYLVAWVLGAPVGHVMLKWPWWPERPVSEVTARYGCSWVEDLAVRPQYRNRGVARALMQCLEELTRAHGLDRVGLDVGVDDGYAAARHLYSSLGYRDVGHGAFLESAALLGGGVWVDWVMTLIKDLG
jgi:GNAT superfamily N-acetyltransferase